MLNISRRIFFITALLILYKVIKNKVAPPFKTAKVELIYGEGFSKTGEALDIATEMGFIKKTGSWYEYSGSKIGQGRETAKTYLKNNPTVLDEIVKKIRTGAI